MTLAEVMIGTLVTMSVTGAAFAMVAPMRAMVQAQPEAADMHQRLRVAVEMLSADLREADEVRLSGAAGIEIVSGDQTRRYFLDEDAGGTLRRVDGASSFPAVDQVAALGFELTTDAAEAVRLVRVTVRVRAGPAVLRGRVLPDQEAQFDVALRRR